MEHGEPAGRTDADGALDARQAEKMRRLREAVQAGHVERGGDEEKYIEYLIRVKKYTAAYGRLNTARRGIPPRIRHYDP